MQPRKIIHIDADCFFAAIEMRDNPSLQQIPLAIGGPANSRGVIATANYLAREFGVKSAISSALAKRLCPQLMIIPGDMAKYRLASEQMRRIFQDYTNKIEPLSLDEAYLDVTEASCCRGSATLMAQEIRQRIEATVGITVSAGIAGNKFLAKIASDWHKPNGQFVVSPDEQEAFIKTVPAKRIWGVGKVGQEKLAALGVHTCADLQLIEMEVLFKHFGSFAYRLAQLARGLDEREVQTSRIRKSVSVEHTFAQDLPSVDDCLAQLPSLLEALDKRLEGRAYGDYLGKFYLKLKFDNFQQTTIETAYQAGHILPSFQRLLVEAFARQNRPVRLIGLGYRLKGVDAQQLSFDFDTDVDMKTD